MKQIIYIVFSFFLVAATCCSRISHSENETHGHGHSHAQEEESGEVELSERQMDIAGIRLGKVELREMTGSLATTGVVAVNALHEGVAVSKLPGVVKRLCVAEGQKVKAGQTVAYVESPEILSLKQDYTVAESEFRMAEREYERQKALASQGAGVRKNLENSKAALALAESSLKTAEARLRQYGVTPGSSGPDSSIAVKAPISGTVVSVETETGGFADMQTPLVRIVDTAAAFCMLQVPEKDVASIKSGQRVEMRLTNDPSATFSGKIAEINPVLDPESRAVPVKVELTEKPSGVELIPGMSVSARVHSGDSRQTETLPEGAVVGSGGKYYIFVLHEVAREGEEEMYHFEKCEVVCGKRDAGFVEIRTMEPIAPDAEIVTAGAFYLNSMTSAHGEHSH